MALNKVTFFDTTYFKLADTNTEGCKDFVSTDEGTTLSDAGIYFTPKYNKTKTDINTKVHHIAHNGHIYTLGTDVIKIETNGNKITDTNSNISLVTSLSADRFEKIISYYVSTIDFSFIFEKLVDLQNQIDDLKGPSPQISENDTPVITLYYIKYDDDNNIISVSDGIELSDKSNINNILLPKDDFNEYRMDEYADNANYTLKDNFGKNITTTYEGEKYDVVALGLNCPSIAHPNYKITNICMPDENNNKYGREIVIDDSSKIIINDNITLIKILDNQDTSARISAIVYGE